MKNQDTYSNTQRTSGTGTSGTPYSFDANAEDRYWSNAYSSEPYYNKQYGYDDYSPAYKLGYESRNRYLGRTYNDVESDLSNDWDKVKGKSRLMWNDAKQAVRAGWHRVERAMPGDADHDGR
jgi:hypothetical protein